MRRPAQNDAEFFEFGTVGAVATLNPLAEEALRAAYQRGASARVERAFGNYAPREVDLIDGDGQMKERLKVERSQFPLTIGSVELVGKGQCVADRDIFVGNFNCDLNNDGTSDMKIFLNRNFVGGVRDISVDTNGDGRPDHRLIRDESFFSSLGIGPLKGINVDIGDDGTIDGYIGFVRNSFGHIDRLVFEQPKRR